MAWWVSTRQAHVMKFKREKWLQEKDKWWKIQVFVKLGKERKRSGLMLMEFVSSWRSYRLRLPRCRECVWYDSSINSFSDWILSIFPHLSSSDTQVWPPALLHLAGVTIIILLSIILRTFALFVLMHWFVCTWIYIGTIILLVNIIRLLLFNLSPSQFIAFTELLWTRRFTIVDY